MENKKEEKKPVIKNKFKVKVLKPFLFAFDCRTQKVVKKDNEIWVHEDQFEGIKKAGLIDGNIIKKQRLANDH